MMAEAPGRSPLVVGLADEAFPFTCEIDFAAILDTPFDGLVDLVDLGLPSAGDGSPSALGSLGDFFPSQNEMALPGSSDGSGAAQQDSNEARWVAPEAGKQLDKTELQKERVRAKNRRWFGRRWLAVVCEAARAAAFGAHGPMCAPVSRTRSRSRPPSSGTCMGGVVT